MTNFKNLVFTTRSKAHKDLGISYLGTTGSSAKIIKNTKILNIDTYVLYLAPHKLSGYNVCPMATKECINGCLNTSGRAGMEINSKNESKIITSRIKKTKLFYENRKFFMKLLISEITFQKEKSEAKGNKFSIRLNGTSDINWNAIKFNGKTVFETFPDVQFYDYTKVPNRFNNIPENYHLTLSYTGYNWNECENVLNNGGNVAVVFNLQKWYNSVNAKPLPISFKGYKVVDADITDYRILDGNGVISGLRWKSIANKEIEKQVRNSKFVVQPNSNDCNYAQQKVAKKNILI